MNLMFSPRAWYEYTGWQLEDKKTLKRVNNLLKDIERNGYDCIGKPEQLKGNFSGWWSVRIDEKNRLIFKIDGEILEIYQCGTHYGEK